MVLLDSWSTHELIENIPFKCIASIILWIKTYCNTAVLKKYCNAFAILKKYCNIAFTIRGWTQLISDMQLWGFFSDYKCILLEVVSLLLRFSYVGFRIHSFILFTTLFCKKSYTSYIVKLLSILSVYCFITPLIFQSQIKLCSWWTNSKVLKTDFWDNDHYGHWHRIHSPTYWIWKGIHAQ